MRGDAASDQCSATFAEALGPTFFSRLLKSSRFETKLLSQMWDGIQPGDPAEASLVSRESLPFAIKINETL